MQSRKCQVPGKRSCAGSCSPLPLPPRALGALHRFYPFLPLCTHLSCNGRGLLPRWVAVKCAVNMGVQRARLSPCFQCLWVDAGKEDCWSGGNSGFDFRSTRRTVGMTSLSLESLLCTVDPCPSHLRGAPSLPPHPPSVLYIPRSLFFRLWSRLAQGRLSLL